MAKRKGNRGKGKTAAFLVSQSNNSSKVAASWYDVLEDRDRKYVDEVVSVMMEQPQAHPWAVAKLLIDELDLSVNVKNVASKIKGLMKDESQKTA